MNRTFLLAALASFACAVPCDDDGLRQSCPNGFEAAPTETSSNVGGTIEPDSSSSSAAETSSSSETHGVLETSSESSSDASTTTAPLESSSEDSSSEADGPAESSSSEAETGAVCEMWADGVYGDCADASGNVDLGACESVSLDCIADDPEMPTAVVCYGPCEMPCDCPAAPAGHEDQVVCEDLTGDDAGDCFISCVEEACPDDMICFEGFICMHEV